MSEATIAEQTVSSETLGPKFRLSGLMILVLGAALSLGVVSRAHLLGTLAPSWFGESPLTRWLGVVVAPLGVTLALALAIQGIGCLGRCGSGTSWKWSFCWRISGLVLLAMLLAEESSLLSIMPSSQWEPNWPPGGISRVALDTRLRLLPVAAVLIMTGLVLGMRPRRSRSAARRTRASAWSGALLVGLGGAMIVATLMIVPYLVLIAIEAVENAKMRPGEVRGLLTSHASRPLKAGLADRLDRAVPAIGLAFVAALVASGWLASNLRRARDRAELGSVRELAIGLALAFAVLSSAGVLVWNTLPMIQPLVVSGLKLTLGTWDFGVIALGFGCFSAGLVVHVSAPEGDTPPRGAVWTPVPGIRIGAWIWMAKGFGVVLLSLVILVSLAVMERQSGSTGRVFPWWLASILSPLRAHGDEVWNWLLGNEWIRMLSSDASLWFPVLILPWLGWRSLGLLVTAWNPRPSPLDHVIDSAASARQFLAYWCALSALLLAAIPTLALTGLVLLHHALEASAP
jgi:hypothetical protein